MLTFLEKYNQLPYEIRDRVSSPEAMALIAELEREYGVNLAIAVMRVMTKDVPADDLKRFFVYEHEMEQRAADELAEKMRERLFSRVGDYLGLAAPEPTDNEESAGDMSAQSGEGRTETGESAQGEAAENTATPAVSEDTAESAGGDGADLPAVSGQQLDIKPVATAENAKFFFSPEDEEEIKALSEKLSAEPAPIDQSAREEEIIAAALTKMPINLSSGLLDNRLKQILKTYIRGIRKRLEAKQSLLKPAEDGGVGLDLNAIERLLTVVDKEKEARISETVMKAPPKIKVPEDAANAQAGAPDASGKKPAAGEKPPIAFDRDAAYDFSRLEKKESGNIETPAPEQQDVKTLEKTAAPAIKTEAPVHPGDNTALKTEETAAENPPVTSAVSVRRPAYQPSPATGIGKKKMEDVKYVPKLTGPVDELKEMDLVNFRRLSDDPLSAAGKIKEKISVLEEENYAQRLAGIKAWRKSPVNGLYLAIGQQSIAEGKPVGEVIAKRKEEGQDCLSEQEFLSIMDLNKSLRF